MKKKIITAIMAFVLMFTVIPNLTGCYGRSRTLVLHSWGYFIDHSTLRDFEAWFLEETGERVRVSVSYFDSNEMVSRNLGDGHSIDLVNPSDYMIQSLIRRNLLQELDAKVVNRFNEVGYDMLMNLTEVYDPTGRFSVPYIWGTYGIMYDARKITGTNRDLLNSWGALFDTSHTMFNNQVTLKESIRDTYGAALLYLYREQLYTASNGFTDYTLPAYRELLEDLFQNFSDSVMTGENGRYQRVGRLLQARRGTIHSFEIDAGKSQMLAGGAQDPSLGLYWSVDAGWAMQQTNGTALGYIIPEEGTNVWVDAWVIPTTAVNTRAANYFIYFSMKPEIARRNALFAGGQASNHQEMLALRAEFETDEEGFFNNPTNANFREAFLEAVFPSAATLQRAAIKGDPGVWLGRLSQMLNDVRAGAWTPNH